MEKSSDPISDTAVTPKPEKKGRSFQFWMMTMALVFCALTGAVYWAVTTVVLPLAQAIEAAEQSQAAASNTTAAVQPRVDLDQFKFAPNAPIGDQLRPALEKWLQEAVHFDGRALASTPDNGAGEFPIEKWQRFVKGQIALEIGGPEVCGSLERRALEEVLLPHVDRHPAVAFFVARSVADTGGVLPLMEKAFLRAESLAGAESLAFLISTDLFWAAYRDKDEERIATSQARALAALEKALRAESGYASQADIVISFILTESSRREFGRRAHSELSEVLSAAPGVKAWVKDWLKARHYLRQAARYSRDKETGKGPLNTRPLVLDALHMARLHLEAALQAKPQCADPAYDLVMLCVTPGYANPLAALRTAFDFSTSVQADHASTQGMFLLALRPIRLGDHATMIRFGEQCLEDGRFDSGRPWLYYDAHKEMRADRGDPESYFKQLDFEKFRQLFEGFEKEPRRALWRVHDRSLAAAISYRCGQYGEAVRWLKLLPGEMDSRALGSLGDSDSTLVQEVSAAFAGPREKTAREGARLEEGFLAAPALKLYREALGEMGDPADAEAPLVAAERRYFEDHAAAMELELAVQTGQTMDLLSSPALHGWRRRGSFWRRSAESSIEFGGKADESSTAHLGRIGPAFTVEGEVAFRDFSPGDGFQLTLGEPELTRFDRWATIHFRREGPEAAVALSRKFDLRASGDTLGNASTLRFTLVAKANHLSLTVNNRTVWVDRLLPEGFVLDDSSKIGIGGITTTTASKIVLQRLQIRRN